MKQFVMVGSAIIYILLLVACAAMFVPATNNPEKKLGDAVYLFDKEQRPLPAERLIKEAISIYLQDNDQIGLANAYWCYGSFFKSSSLEKWHVHYEKHGFLDNTATYKNRYQKSIEYFEKARDIYLANSMYDHVSNVFIQIGFSYELMNNVQAACTAYDKCLVFHRKWRDLRPNSKVEVPPGYQTFEEYVLSCKKRIQCP